MARLTARLPTLSPIAAAAWLLATHALAQTAPDSAQLQPVTVTGRATPPASVSGWGDIPLAKTPVQASVFDAAQLKDSGVQRLSDLTAADPAVSDAYNAEGYWDFLTVRGYVIDNRFNFRRDGLPINAETSIPLDNKARVEILKGTSGMQAGTSAPGGLVNYVVKRPLDAPLSSIGLEWRQPGTVTAAFDLSRRFGVDNAFGVRLNAAAAHLDPMVRDSEGRRHLFALAGDWRVSPDTLLEAEIETSRRSQPSQPGFSMLGDTVPPPGDPRLSLNNQPWSLPVVMNATTASLRWQQRLSTAWRFVAHAATQQLRTDDRLAFPFGCFDPNPAPDGTYYADRYCPNGTYDLYDFRSENERRRTDALDLSLQGKLQTGAIAHTLTAGVLQSRVRNRFQQQAYNYVGTGNVEGTLFTSADPSLTDENTNRDERSTELYLRDAVALTDAATAWLGVRHSRIERESVRTDGSRPTDYAQSFVTPSIALSYAFARDQLVYASWGQGVESNVVTNRPRYSNAGEVFTTKSRQAEIGLKGASDAFDWNLAAFDIRRPRTQDFGSCDADATCTTRLDGSAHHRGIEASAGWRRGAWALRGGAQWLRAKVEGSADPTIDGKQPTNVPQRTLKLQAAYDVAALPGLNLQAGLVHESARMVLPDNSASIPGWTRVDAALRYESRVAGVRTTWRAGVDNLFDKRAWRESPYQFSHVYLYPLAPRTFRLSMQVDL
jgi:iron complex outermembrane receptor protein